MNIRLLAATLAALLISGCATHREFKDIDAQATTTADRAQSLHDNNAQKSDSPGLRLSNSTWVNPEPVKLANAENNLPVCWPQINRADTLTLDDVAALISDTCHINVRVLPDARMGQTAVASTQAIKGDLPLPGSDDRGRTLLNQTNAAKKTILTSSSASISGLRWDRDLGGLLNYVSPRYGVSWRWQDEQIQFFRLDTRTYQLAILNADTSMNAKVVGGTSSTTGTSGSGSSSSLSGTQSSSQQTAVAVASKVYDDIKSTVADMLSAEGSSWLAPGSATLTVTDTPEVLSRVSAFIERQNAILDRQVRLKVDIYRITFKDSKQLGIDWTAVYGKAKSLGYTLTSSFTGASADIATIGLTSASGSLSGSEVLVKALNEQANISSWSTYTSVTTNMVPAPLQIARQTTYLAKTSTTTSETYSSTEMQPGEITTGLFMTVLPYIRDNGTVQLQLSFSLSDEPVIETVTSPNGNSAIQTPTTDLRSSAQRTNLQPGQTLVLNGYQSLYNEANRQGTTSKSWFGFGGGESGKRDRSILLILVTPSLTL